MSVTVGAMPSSPAARIGRLIAIVLVFVLLGPPIGAAVWVALVAGIGTHWQVEPQGLVRVTLLGLIVAGPLSYLYGAAPAAAVGLAIGIRQAFFGRAAWPLPLAAGLLVGIAAVYGGGEGPFAGAPEEIPVLQYPAIMILSCVVPTMLCWAIVRRWHVALPPPSGAAS